MTQFVQGITRVGDTLFGTEFPEVILGSQPDTILGLSGDDRITPFEGGLSDLFGNQDNDTLASQGPGNTLHGGQGNDVLLSQGGSIMYGDKGDDSLTGVSVSGGIFEPQAGGGDDSMYGGDDNDLLIAAPTGNSFLFGNKGNDTLFHGAATDKVYGGQDDDYIVGSFASALYGDKGNDTLIVAEGAEKGITLYGGGNYEDGTPDNDSLVGGSNSAFLFGNVGSDTLLVGATDTAFGGQGNDQLLGQGSAAYLSGDKGNDTLTSGSDAATLLGGAGDDAYSITAGGSNVIQDSLGGGSVTFANTAGAGNKAIVGGSGAYTVDVATTLPGNEIDLRSSTANNVVDGSSSDGLLVYLGSGADTVHTGVQTTIVGADANDVIKGTNPFTLLGSGAAGFRITGTPLSDNLTGGGGNDTIEGLGSVDTLTGGAGEDIFLFQKSADIPNLLALGGSARSILNDGTVAAQTTIILRSTGGTANGVVAEADTLTIGGAVGTIAANVGTNRYPTPAAALGNVGFPNSGTASLVNEGAVAPGASPGTFAFGVLGTSQVDGGNDSQRLAFTIGAGTLTYGDAISGNYNYQYGTNAGEVVALGSVVTGAGAVLVDQNYGYSPTEGFDIITDYQVGVDRIFLDDALFSGPNAPSPTAPTVLGTFTGSTASVLGTVQNGNNFAYNTETGVLYYRPADPGAGLTGTTISGDPLQSVATSVTYFGTANIGAGAVISDDPGIIAAGGNAGGGVGQVTFDFQSNLPGAGAGTANSAAVSIGAATPIPFLQILNNGNPVEGLTFRDIVIF